MTDRENDSNCVDERLRENRVRRQKEREKERGSAHGERVDIVVTSWKKREENRRRSTFVGLNDEYTHAIIMHGTLALVRTIEGILFTRR